MTSAGAARVYLGLGGNLGDVPATLQQALVEIDRLPQTRVVQCSRSYRTPAWGMTEQPDFINAVVELHTALAARTLLEGLQAIERRLGRDRTTDVRWGPRTLDLDVLLYGDSVMDEPGLTVPHPRMHVRAFVLLPLADIAPDLVLPGHGGIATLLAGLDLSGIAVLD